jgi:hypothetical protein
LKQSATINKNLRDKFWVTVVKLDKFSNF